MPRKFNWSFDVVCAGNYDAVGDYCIFVDAFVETNFDAAERACQDRDGELISITNLDIFITVLDYLKEKSTYQTDNKIMDKMNIWTRLNFALG